MVSEVSLPKAQAGEDDTCRIPWVRHFHLQMMAHTDVNNIRAVALNQYLSIVRY